MEARRANIQRVRNEVKNSKQRSAWGRGVQAYALDLLDQFTEWADWKAAKGLKPENIDERTALNGARDWAQWAWGGCGLCYNSAIAKRLCNPSELRRVEGGNKAPNKYEQWPDVEARAMRQAWAMIAKIVRRLEKKQA